jgi:hypothetical protein
MQNNAINTQTDAEHFVRRNSGWEIYIDTLLVLLLLLLLLLLILLVKLTTTYHEITIQSGMLQRTVFFNKIRMLQRKIF